MLQVRDLCKRFGPTVANDKISFDLASGEVLGVLGENGAGKSTLMHVLSGLIPPDSGEICLDGASIRFASSRDASDHGIDMVHQHFRLADALSVEDNLALGDPEHGRYFINRARLRHDASTIARQLGFAVPFESSVSMLGVAEQQRVEILKALLRRPRILILDEPTAVLPPETREGLFALVRALTSQGTAVLLISHRLGDVDACCDRVLVLRQGQAVAEMPASAASPAGLISLMFGSAAMPELAGRGSRGAGHSDEGPLLSVKGLNVAGRPGVRSAEFCLYPGEILGLCGVDGNGQSDLVQTIAGMRTPAAGQMIYRLRGEERSGPLGPGLLRRLGVAHIPEDRLRYGVVAEASLSVNWRLTTLDLPQGRRAASARAALKDAIQTFEIRASGLNVPLQSLSGGNQQKLVLARELSSKPSIILAANATRGVDFRTAARIGKILRDARDQGAGVLMLSADLEELWALADRIMVMTDGRLRGPLSVTGSSQAEVGHWMTAA